MYEYSRQHTVKDPQHFLGTVNFYHRFLPRIAQVLSPLTDLLKGKELPKILSCEECHNVAFAAAKAALATAMSLAHPRADDQVAIATDTHIGGVLQQQVQGYWQLLGFFSRRLLATEANYSTFDRELLVV
jgi:hypothetical protein